MRRKRWALRVGAVAAASLVGVLAVAVVEAAPSGWLALDGLMRFNPASGATYDWANSGAGATNTCPAGAVNLSGSGGIFNCGLPTGAATLPIAPTLTPAAATDPSIISAVFIVDPISVDSTSCGAGDPTTLGGTNGQAITSYSLSNGPVPNKDDLSNVYAVSHTRADNGHPELYFAAERLVNNGDSHIDFEFLQSSITLTPCGGSFSGHRTEGDLLVSVDFTNGGALAGTSVFQWHCAAEPGPQPADGTVCDPASGPTPPQHYQLISGASFLSFLVNSVDIQCGGWVCRDASGAGVATVLTNDFLEGGIDLASVPFAGCFNTFLPHTRTSGQVTAQLKDFAGPVGFRSCRDPAVASSSAPAGSAMAPGTAATDSVTVGNGGAGPVPTGTVTFFLCSPAQTTAGGCPSGGAQVGSAKPLLAGAATSDPTTATSSLGTYCWRTEYAPDVAATGVFAAATHTNATSECFGVAASGPGLPNTGVPFSAPQPAPQLPGAVLLVGALVAMAWRRSRGVTVLLIAGLVAGSSPSPPSQAAPAAPGFDAVQLDHRIPRERSTIPLALDNVTPQQLEPAAWRLVIASIGVDATIEPVGLDAQRAMAAPSSLDTVGWFSGGPAPGVPGDAVIDGHYGLPSTPAVFRRLASLRPGDAVQVIWPDGHYIQFLVESVASLAANSQPPPDLFSRSGPAHLSLITCAGQWDQGQRTYSERLIVTARLAS